LVEIDKSTNGLKYLNGQGGVFRLFSGQKMIKGDTGFSELQRVGLVQFRAAVQFSVLYSNLSGTFWKKLTLYNHIKYWTSDRFQRVQMVARNIDFYCQL